MKEFKGTKGKWVSAESDSVKCNGELISMTATLIERVDETREEGESWLSMRERTNHKRVAVNEERKANTKLIAAAPDLLKVLQVFVDFPEEDLESCIKENCSYTMTVQGKHLEAAINAINKAL